LGLGLSEPKTAVHTFQEGFEFLGAFFLRDKVYTPWRREHPRGRVLFMAHPMPHRLLEDFVSRKRGRPGAGGRHAAAGVQPGPPAAAEREDMAFLYLTEQGAVLRKSGDRVLVEAEGRVALDLPYHKLEAVLLFGNVQVTSQAMGSSSCSARRVPRKPKPSESRKPKRMRTFISLKAHGQS
jgi:CRISPR associated protein Cas1